MAEAFPSVILKLVLKQLESPIFQNNKLNCRLRIQFRDLRSKLELFKDVIDDAESMAVLFPEEVRGWVCELQRVLYEVDDLLDEALTRSMSLDSDGMVEKVHLRLDNLPFDLAFSRKMGNINKRLESIVKECCNCNLLAVVDPGQQPPQPSSCGNMVVGANEKLVEKLIARKGILRYDPDYVKDDEFHMIGREDHMIGVIEMLFDDDDCDDVGVIGQAGVGKTTLCRAVYNDEKVRNHFQIRIWVGMRSLDYYSCIDMWKKIIRKLGVEEAPLHGETDEELQLKDKIVSFIGKRKTLLVLDDIPPCFELYAPEKIRYFWDEVHNLIAATDKGSKVLLSSSPGCLDFGVKRCAPLYMSLDDLPEEHSLSIFGKVALVPGRDRPDWMIDLGKEIVSKCLGNPALLKGVGTLLHGKDDIATWHRYAHDFDFESHYGRYNKFSENLYAYHNITHQFGYLRLFSLSHFKYKTIFQQLDAHGFANFSEQLTTLNLVRSIFRNVDQVFSDSWDLEEDLMISGDKSNDASQTAGTECTVLNWRDTHLSEVVRHVSIVRPPSSADHRQQNIILSNSLSNDVIRRRSLLFIGNILPIRMSVRILDKLASNLRYLRVLDLQDMALQELPSSVGMLIHLRYLDLSRNDFRRLPNSICKLKNLLTLKLVYCDKLVKLPRRIRNLHRLKHLEINMCWDLTHLPSTIARLTCLEELDRFIVGPRRGGLRYLEQLDNLKGRLSLELPQQWEDSKTDAEGAYLERKKGLTTLEFKRQGTGDGDDNDGVLERLKPCIGIKNLLIVKFGGTRLSSWITTLDSLTMITISECKRCEILPPFHRMPHLRSLTLTSLNIEYVVEEDNTHNDNNGFYPSLVELKIGRMDRLKGWSGDSNTVADGLLRFRREMTVEIWKCTCLTTMPSFSKLTYMVLQGVSEKMLQLIDRGECPDIEIVSIQYMASLPDEFVTKPLWKLIIRDCSQLQALWGNEVEGTTKAWGSLPPGGFRHIEDLRIINCPGIKHLSNTLRHLTTLTYLMISKCSEELDCLYKEEEDGMPWTALQRLNHLVIEGFENLVALPKGLLNIPMLWGLTIRDCKALKWESDRAPKIMYKLKFNSCPHITPIIEELKRAYQGVDVSE